jgi:XTP/dITP diphosphohydrolase
VSSLLVATNNAGKLREFRQLLPGVQLVVPAELGLNLKIEETGTTFAANAQIKAEACAAATGLVAMADDSGLEVDALNGAPGVHSARYGGSALDDRGRWQLLLQVLSSFPDPAQRRARFRCVIVVAAPDGRTIHAEGACEGTIALTPAGDRGFGYDPVFYLPEQGQTMAEVDSALKNQLSHRARALAGLQPRLLTSFPELRPDG